jgi:hypothetical protein
MICQSCTKETFEYQVSFDGFVLCPDCLSDGFVCCPNCGETCEDVICSECGAKSNIPPTEFRKA